MSLWLIIMTERSVSAVLALDSSDFQYFNPANDASAESIAMAQFNTSLTFRLIEWQALGLIVVMPCTPVNAAELSTDQIRGLSNQELCSYLDEDRREEAEIAVEISKRSLECSTLSQEHSAWDYTPDATTEMTRDPFIPSPQANVGLTEPTRINNAEFKDTEPEELANLQVEVQREAARLQQQQWAGVEENPARIAPQIQPSRPFYPPSSVVRISTGKAVGSGFYARETLIVTNAHVVGDTTNIAISFSGQPPFLGQVVFRNDDLDFAIIETLIPGTPLPLRRGPVTVGEHIIAMGFPQGRQIVASSTGTVMDIADCCIAHDAMVAGGSSGGPLLDARYQVLGLNTLLRKKPDDKANETDRAITVRMDFIARILASEQSKATLTE